ncbi:hypothetical protein DSUL_160021 [Desulfovibrionales bacterium]
MSKIASVSAWLAFYTEILTVCFTTNPFFRCLFSILYLSALQKNMDALGVYIIIAIYYIIDTTGRRQLSYSRRFLVSLGEGQPLGRNATHLTVVV